MIEDYIYVNNHNIEKPIKENKISFMMKIKYDVHKEAIETATELIINNPSVLYSRMLKYFKNSSQVAIALLVYFDFCRIEDLTGEIKESNRIIKECQAMDKLFNKTKIEFIPMKPYERKRLGIKYRHPHTNGYYFLTEEQEKRLVFKF